MGLSNPARQAGQTFTLAKLSIARRVGINSVWLVLTRVVIQLQLMLFTLLVARRLGVAGFGQYAFIASVILLGNIVTTFGTDTLLIRDVSRVRGTAGTEVPAALWIQLALSVVFIGVIFAGADRLSNNTPGTLESLKLYALALVALAFYGVFTAVLRAYERMDLYLLANLATAFVQIAGAWLVLHGQAGLQSLVTALIATQLCAAGFAGVLCYRRIPGFSIGWAISLRAVAKTLRVVWPLALLSILAVIYQRLGVLMLATQAGDAPTGWFSAAARIVEPLKIVHFAVLGALLPALSRLTGNGVEVDQAARGVFSKSFWLLFGFGALAAAGVFLAAQPLVELLYGASFAPTSTALQVMIWSLIPYTLSASLSLLLIVRQQERRVLLATVLSLAAALILNLWLIPGYGLLGAAGAVLIGETVQAGVFVWLGRAR